MFACARLYAHTTPAILTAPVKKMAVVKLSEYINLS